MRRLILQLLTVAVAAMSTMSFAGADGYLRQGPAFPLRYASVPMARPLVDLEVLALSRPPQPQPIAEVATEPELALYLTEAVKALITARVKELNAGIEALAPVVVDAPVAVASWEDPTLIPGSPAIPISTAAAAATSVDDLITIFQGAGGGSDRRDKGAIIAVPTGFIAPPTPVSPPSRAIYSVPGP